MDEKKNAAKLLDALRDRFQIKNDAALARELDLTPGTICKLRSGGLAVGAVVILRIHEYLGLTVAEIRALAA